MKIIGWFLFVMLLLFPLRATYSGKENLRATKVSITSRLDRTAFWVGDTLNYTIRAIHGSDVEFVLDNLKRDKLPLAPFVVREIKIQQGDWTQNKKLLEITLRLSSYEVGKEELTIPPFNLYYFVRRNYRKEGEASAEAIQVPAASVGLRSTLIGNHVLC